MKIGIVHGAGINPDGTLQPHTKARADLALKLYDIEIDKLIVCGRNEAPFISSYLINKGIKRDDIIEESLSYSTLSNLYYSKIILYIVSRYQNVEKIYPISNFWHIPRLCYDAKNVLKGYQVECLAANDPRNEQEIKAGMKMELIKLVVDRILIKLGYGKSINENYLNNVSPILSQPQKIKEEILLNVVSRYQRKLMDLEKSLYSMMKILT